jgi:hypothetical protein
MDINLSYVAGAAPIWARQPDQSLWREVREGGALYVNFRADDELRSRTEALFADVDRLRPRRMILDMRDNSGGDFTLFRARTKAMCCLS